MLTDVYREAVERAAIETKLTIADFPTECEYTLELLLSFTPNGDTV